MYQLERATLAALFVEGILYGLYTLLFSASIVVLLIKRRRERRFNHALCIVSIVMYVLATTHIITSLCQAIQGFVIHHDDPETYFTDSVQTPYFVIKNLVYIVQTLVGDGFMVYRLYLIWSGNKLVCFPVLVCFAACLVTAAGGLVLSQRSNMDHTIYSDNLRTWIIAFLSTTLLTDLACTLLIVIRIWTVHSAVRHISISGPSLKPAVAIIMESGAIYSLWIAGVLGLFLSGNYGHKIAIDALVQMIGIVFSIIIVRVGLRISAEYDNRSSSQPQLGTIIFDNAVRRTTFSQNRMGSVSEPNAIPLRTRREGSACCPFETRGATKLQEDHTDTLESRPSEIGKRPPIDYVEEGDLRQAYQ